MMGTKARYKRNVLLFLIVLMLYLVGSLCCEFEYLDLGYLVVVVIGFIRVLNVREKN